MQAAPGVPALGRFVAPEQAGAIEQTGDRGADERGDDEEPELRQGLAANGITAETLALPAGEATKG